MNTISMRRVAGFVVLALAIVVGTMSFGVAVSSCQPHATPTAPPQPTPAVSLAPTAEISPGAVSTPTPSPGTSTPTTVPGRIPMPTAFVVPRASDEPRLGGTIPPFVPVPSGPVP